MSMCIKLLRSSAAKRIFSQQQATPEKLWVFKKGQFLAPVVRGKKPPKNYARPAKSEYMSLTERGTSDGLLRRDRWVSWTYMSCAEQLSGDLRRHTASPPPPPCARFCGSRAEATDLGVWPRFYLRACSGCRYRRCRRTLHQVPSEWESGQKRCGQLAYLHEIEKFLEKIQRCYAR